MAISEMTARLIVQDHKRSSLTGARVLCLGRQSIWFDFETAVRICHEEGYIPPTEILQRIKVQGDDATRFAGRIDDNTFFALFGVRSLSSMDQSDYERATIIHDLNYPVGKDLLASFDYIVDGGTLDHIIDLRVALENITKMLVDGGRILLWNACSNNTLGCYCSFSPAFFFDYFAANNYAYCHTFLCESVRMEARKDSFIYRVDPLKHGEFKTEKYLMIIAFAQKRGDGATLTGKLPIQMQYRIGAVGEEYASVAAASSGDFCISTMISTSEKLYKRPFLQRVIRYVLWRLNLHDGLFYGDMNDPKTNLIGYRYEGRL